MKMVYRTSSNFQQVSFYCVSTRTKYLMTVHLKRGFYKASSFRPTGLFYFIQVYCISIPIKEQCVFVGLSVCLLFIGHTTFVHFAALPPSVRVSRSRCGRPRARGGQACICESTRAHAVQLPNEKIAALMPFKNKAVRARMLSYT